MSILAPIPNDTLAGLAKETAKVLREGGTPLYAPQLLLDELADRLDATWDIDQETGQENQ